MKTDALLERLAELGVQEPVRSEMLRVAVRAGTQFGLDEDDLLAALPGLSRYERSSDETVLMAACSAGRARALTVFRERVIGDATSGVGERYGSELRGEDLAQAVAQRLFVGDDGARRLASWKGTSPLSSWVRAIATRLALNARKKAITADADEAAAMLERLPAGEDPQFQLLRREHQHQLANALRDALKRLPQRERSVLRLAVFQGLSTEQLGRMFQVNPATARRWIQGARETVLERVRAQLQGGAGLSVSQVDSLVRGVHSGLELSLNALRSHEE